MRQSKKRNIFDSAVRLFSEQGFTATTIRQIAKASEMNEASIYYYFENKEAILNEIFREFRFMPKSYIPSKKKIDAYLKTEAPRQLLSRFIPSRSVKDALFISQVYRIVFREQFINAKAGELVREHLIGEYSESLCYALDCLTEAGQTAPQIKEPDWKTFSLLWTSNMFTQLSINGFDACANGGRENGIDVTGKCLIEMAITGKIP